MKQHRAAVLARCYLIDGCYQSGASATIRILMSSQLAVAPVNDEMSSVIAENAVVIRAAVYRDSVLKNGWQPYDQPSPAAYVPLSFKAMKRHRLRGFGQLLVEAQPSRGPVSTFTYRETAHGFSRVVSSLDEVWATIVEICERVGVPPRIANALPKATGGADLLAA